MASSCQASSSRRDVVEDLDHGLLRPAGAVQGPHLLGRQRVTLDHGQVAADDAGRGAQLMSEQRQQTGGIVRRHGVHGTMARARMSRAGSDGAADTAAPGPTSDRQGAADALQGRWCANRLTAGRGCRRHPCGWARA